MFQLDHRLAQDCLLITELPLSLVLLMNDSQYPWTILVPKVEGVREILDLSVAQQQQLWIESATLTRAMQSRYQPDKMNLAALGNVVEQLHLHHIARFRQDIAWPAPVWGKHPAQAYTAEQARSECEAISELLAEFKA
ncbi:HIT domain-containing protein [Bowmanella pacifica]|uniref:Histidine triad (HIT) protein n=1 Tax=Bowmanella pacifica TaxID=502051 RepID=A0A917YZE5_9ALTE|nr:HIT domain-containing protein [Bowmanella pacifica]GGO70700.1 histidine triad (HIT) protein [Bowmanella pacifica]